MNPFEKKILDKKIQELIKEKEFFKNSHIPNFFFYSLFKNVKKSTFDNQQMLYIDGDNMFPIYKHKASANTTGTLYFYLDNNYVKNGDVYYVSKNSIILNSFSLKKNVPHGICNIFYPNGNKMLELEFKDGYVDGTVDEYRIDGLLLRKSYYSKSILHGVRTYYLENNHYRKIYFDKGIPYFEKIYNNQQVIFEKIYENEDVYKYFGLENYFDKNINKIEKPNTRFSIENTKNEVKHKSYLNIKNLEYLFNENNSENDSENDSENNSEKNESKKRPKKYKKHRISKKRRLS